MNLGGVTYFASESPLIDRMRLIGDPVRPGAAPTPDAATVLPSSAGSVARIVPLDPGLHDYVILCDAAVAKVGINGAVRPPVVSRGRATFTANRPDVNFASQLTITASGPVGKFALMRAEHEAAFLKGEIWNPDFISRVSPFKLIRPLDWNGTNAEIFPAQRPGPTDAFFQDTRGGMPAEYAAQLASKIGAKLWYPINHLMPDAQILDVLRAIEANAGSSAVDLEWSNEFGWTYHRGWAYAHAAARYGIANPQALDMLRFYGYIAGHVANLAKSVSQRFKINLSGQPSATPDKTINAILAGWDEAKAPRSMIAGFANAGYINFNYPPDDFQALLALQAANDIEGFFAMAATKIDVLKARYVATAAACRAAAIPFKIYEHNISIYSQAPYMRDAVARQALLDWITPLIHSDRMADLLIRNAQNMANAGAVEACFYQLTGAGSQYGFWGCMPHISQAPYPIYDRLLKARIIKAAAATDISTPRSPLLLEVAALAAGSTLAAQLLFLGRKGGTARK